MTSGRQYLVRKGLILKGHLRSVLFAAICLLTALSSPVTFAQTAPLTYPQILTALNAKLPAGMTKTKLNEKLIADVKRRKVDKPLTPDREDLLRQAGATEELVTTIRQNSGSAPATKQSPRSDEISRVLNRQMSKADEDKLAEGRVAFDKFKDCPTALKALQSVSTAGEYNASWLLYMAKTHECLFDYEEAIEFYKKYDALAPGHPEIADKLAELRYQADPDNARKLIVNLVNSVGTLNLKSPLLAPDTLARTRTSTINSFYGCSISEVVRDTVLNGLYTSRTVAIPVADIDPSSVGIAADNLYSTGYTVGLTIKDLAKTIKTSQRTTFSNGATNDIVEMYSSEVFYLGPDKDKADRVAKALIQVVKACQKEK